MYDVTIIGGGIVGLSTAYQLLLENSSLKICVLDKELAVAQHQSSHNSGVIHSGIYYDPTSQKARNCREGYQQLLNFCQVNNIPFDTCGKLIVATNSGEVNSLANIYRRGLANQLSGLQLLSEKEALKIEPHIRCVQAILVPQAGIVNFGKVAKMYAQRFRALGGEIKLGVKVIQMKEEQDQVKIIAQTAELTSRYFVSCAGLYADKIAELTIPKHGFQILPFRGEYFTLKQDKQFLVNHLIYPVPDPSFPFLGVHFTRMIEGGIEAGPNAVLAFRREGYHRSQISLHEFVDTISHKGFQKLATKYWRTGWKEMQRSFSKPHFVRALQKLIPSIRCNDLVRGRSGVRAMACDLNGKMIDDFLILDSNRGLHVVSAPSPAATASLTIGKEIITRLLKKATI